MLDLDWLKEHWNAYVAGPDVLFMIRMISASIMGISVITTWWEVFQPTDADRMADRTRYHQIAWVVMRVFIALGATVYLTYLLLAGGLEHDRAATPFRLLFGNVAVWLVFLGQNGMYLLRRLWFYQRALVRQVEAVVKEKVRG